MPTATVDLGLREWTEFRNRQNTLGTANTAAGSSVAVSADGSVMVLGATNFIVSSNESGAVFRYTWNGTSWVEDVPARLLSDGDAFQQFGQNVQLSADGNTLVVSAHRYGTTPEGRVYTYDWNGSAWIERNNIPAFLTYDSSDPDFGNPVRLSGDGNQLVIGCTSNAHPYIYTYDRNVSAWDFRIEHTFDGVNTFSRMRLLDVTNDGSKMLALTVDANSDWTYAIYDLIGTNWVLDVLIPVYNGGNQWFPDGTTRFSPDGNMFLTCIDPGNDNAFPGTGDFILNRTFVLYDKTADGAWTLPTDVKPLYVPEDINQNNWTNFQWLNDTQIIFVTEQWEARDGTSDFYAEVAYYELGPELVPYEFESFGSVERRNFGTSEALDYNWDLLTELGPNGLSVPDFTSNDTFNIHGLDLSADGLTLVAHSGDGDYVVVLKRVGLNEPWALFQVLNQRWNPDSGGFWDQDELGFNLATDGTWWAASSISGDGRTISVSMDINSTTYLDPDYDLSFFEGAINGGGWAIYVFNDALGKYQLESYVQPDVQDGTCYHASLNSDGTVLWGFAWTSGSSGVYRFSRGTNSTWQQDDKLTITAGVNPAWTVNIKESLYCDASPDGTAAFVHFWESVSDPPFLTARVEWNGSNLVRVGDVQYLPVGLEFGRFAHVVATSLRAAADGTVLYAFIVGTELNGYIGVFDWSSGTNQWVLRQYIKGPIEDYSYQYTAGAIAVSEGETCVVLRQYLSADTPPGTDLGVTNATDAAFLVTLTQPEEDNCYVKTADNSQLIEIGTRCVAEWVPPPNLPTDDDTNPNLPRPPTATIDDPNEPNPDCDESGLHLTEAVFDPFVAVTANPEFKQWLEENRDQIDIQYGICN